jgi:hypothetical protein
VVSLGLSFSMEADSFPPSSRSGGVRTEEVRAGGVLR